VKLHGRLWINGGQSGHVTLMVKDGTAIRAWGNVLERKVLNVATPLHLIHLVGLYRLLELRGLLLSPVVLKLAGTLLCRIDTSEQTARNGLNRRYPGL
jgi:hypothetical protein